MFYITFCVISKNGIQFLHQVFKFNAVKDIYLLNVDRLYFGRQPSKWPRTERVFLQVAAVGRTD